MTRYLSRPLHTRHVARVTSFHDDQGLFESATPGPTGCRVRVTHASVGSTDVIARRGDYLLHPLPGFISGYDFVGVLKTVTASARRRGLEQGQRVAGILPNMGAHASLLNVPASLMVAVPDDLASEVAATLPLDGVTAKHALDLLLPGGSSVFISGVTGAVGFLAAQLALDRKLRVAGTAPQASITSAGRYGAIAFDYRDADWQNRVLKEFGPVDGLIDHTGATLVRKIVNAKRRIVRTAFGGAAGQQKKATATGFTRTLARRIANPSEVLCSTPIYVAVKRAAYRRDLGALFEMASRGQLTVPTPDLYNSGQLPAALKAAGSQRVGAKAVLEFTG